MESESEKIISDQVKKLPREVKEALASEDLHKNILSIGQAHHLHVDQIGLLEDETVLVMMGLAAPADFPQEIVKQLSVSQADAEAIAGEVSDKIFLPIREAMKKFTEQPELEKSVVMPSAAASAPIPPAPKPIEQIVPAAKPITTPAAPALTVPSTPAPASLPAPAKVPEIHAADMMLSQPTISLPKPAAPATTAAPLPPQPKAPASSPATPVVKDAAYKQDPYREPPE